MVEHHRRGRPADGQGSSGATGMADAEERRALSLQSASAGFPWILTGDLEGLKYIGLRPRRKIKMFNGPIETRLINIPLYKGSKKTKKI